MITLYPEVVLFHVDDTHNRDDLWPEDIPHPNTGDQATDCDELKRAILRVFLSHHRTLLSRGCAVFFIGFCGIKKNAVFA